MFLLSVQVIKAGGVVKDADYLVDIHESVAFDVSQDNIDLCLGFIMDGTSANRKALRQLEVNRS
jgi:hypothetical protein